jgi:hypothetical protein
MSALERLWRRRDGGVESREYRVPIGLSIADPAHPGMLDVVGFGAAAPQRISDFAQGAL